MQSLQAARDACFAGRQPFQSDPLDRLVSAKRIGSTQSASGIAMPGAHDTGVKVMDGMIGLWRVFAGRLRRGRTWEAGFR